MGVYEVNLLKSKTHLASSKDNLSLPRREHRVLRSGLGLKKDEEAAFQLNPEFLAEVLYWINLFSVLPERGHHCPAI